MQLEVIFVIGMFLTFGVLLFSGYPVAWILAGTAGGFAGPATAAIGRARAISTTTGRISRQ